MTEGEKAEGGRAEAEKARLVAWSHEMREVHHRLREALRLARESLASGEAPTAVERDLLLFCHGFCIALDGHHEGEDQQLFPAIAVAHPELREALWKLHQDHSMIAHLLAGMRAAIERVAGADELDRHLEGISAIMESHFRYEERALLVILDSLALDATPAAVFGPLASR